MSYYHVIGWMFISIQGLLDLKPRPGMYLTAGVGAAVGGLTMGLAVDLAPVRVNVVSPGAVHVAFCV